MNEQYICDHYFQLVRYMIRKFHTKKLIVLIYIQTIKTSRRIKISRNILINTATEQNTSPPDNIQKISICLENVGVKFSKKKRIPKTTLFPIIHYKNVGKLILNVERT